MLPAVGSPADFDVIQSGQGAHTAAEDSQPEFQAFEETVAESVTAEATASEFSDSEPAESPAAAVQSLPVVQQKIDRPSVSGPEFDEFPAETDQEDLFAMELEKTETATALPAVSSGTKSNVVTQAEQGAKADLSRVKTGTSRPIKASGEKDCGEGQVVEWNPEGVRDREKVSEEVDFGTHLAETPLSPVTGTVKGTARTPAAAMDAKSALVADATDSDKVEILFDVSELESARRESITEDFAIAPVVHETSSAVDETFPSAEESLPTWDISQRMTVKGPRRVLVPELEFEEWVNHGVPRGGPEHGGTLVRPFTPQPISPMRSAVARVRGSMEEAFDRIPGWLPLRSENSSGKRAGRPALSTKSTVAAGTTAPGGKAVTRVQPRPSTASKPVGSEGRKITPAGGVVRAGWSTDEPTSAGPRRISPSTAASGSQTQGRQLSPR